MTLKRLAKSDIGPEHVRSHDGSRILLHQFDYVYHLKDKICSPISAKQCPSNPNCFVDLEDKRLLDCSQEKLNAEVVSVLGKCPSEQVKKEEVPYVGLKVSVTVTPTDQMCRTSVPHVTSTAYYRVSIGWTN